MTLDPVAGLLLVASFMILYASAALHKLRHFEQFDSVFKAYDLLPRPTRRYAARALPWLELGVALGLPARSSRPFAAAGGIVLLLGYALAMAINLRRGRYALACGCGGVGEERPIAAWMVWRNALLALFLGTVLWPWSARALTLIDAFTIACGAGVIVLVYLSLDELGRVIWGAPDLPGSR
jgi:hypothetical protein